MQLAGTGAPTMFGAYTYPSVMHVCADSNRQLVYVTDQSNRCAAPASTTSEQHCAAGLWRWWLLALLLATLCW